VHILFLCHFLPYSLARDSGRLDTFHYISSLSKQHAVSVIAFVSPEDENCLPEMQQICEEVVVLPYQENALIPRLVRAWWRLLLPKVYGRNHSRAYRQALQSLLERRHFDVVIVHGMMAEYGRYLKNTPKILDEVDLFFMVAHQMFRKTGALLPRFWAGFDWLRTLVWETHYLTVYDGVFVRSAKDESIVRDLVPQQKLAVLPPWFEGLAELQQIPIERPPHNNLLFVGAMNIPSNVEAVTFFVQQVLPRIRAHVPDVQFYIVGSNPSPSVQRLGQEQGVIVTGEVPSLAPYYAAASVVVVPLFVGGGIIVKTLNGLASGRPVVTTAVGNSGTGAQQGRDLCLVSPDPQEMAITICDLLSNPNRWEQFANSGREFIRTHYDWKETVSGLTYFLRGIS